MLWLGVHSLSAAGPAHSKAKARRRRAGVPLFRWGYNESAVKMAIDDNCIALTLI